jgi:multidrug efflux system membrane fusion protein
VALLLAGCKKAALPEPPVQTVRAGAAEPIQPDAPERYSATIAPLAQVDLAFKSAGLIERIHQVRGADGRLRDVQTGDRVDKDTELAMVRTVDYQQRVDHAEALLGQSEAQLAETRADFNEAEIEFSRATNLFESGSLVKPQFDQAKGRYESLQAAVKSAEAAVANARATLSEAKLSLSDTSIRSPFAGWISARDVDQGSLAGNSTIGFSMMDTHLVKAVFAVPDSSLRLVRLGKKQVVTLDALRYDVPGVVTSISPQADPKSRVFSVEVTIDNPREEVRPGMIGSVVLDAAPDMKPRLAVPLGAVVRDPSDPAGFAVFRLSERGGKTYAVAQKIQIGRTFGNAIEVNSGLSAGQHIIALGGSLVRDGQEVRVLP